MNRPRINAHSDDEEVEALRNVLLFRTGNTLLPELFHVFGRDALFKFLDVFAGMTIKVPKQDVLYNVVRDTAIFVALSKNTTEEQLDFLAKKYEISHAHVVNIYEDIRGILNGSTGSDRQKAIKRQVYEDSRRNGAEPREYVRRPKKSRKRKLTKGAEEEDKEG